MRGLIIFFISFYISNCYSQFNYETVEIEKSYPPTYQAYGYEKSIKFYFNQPTIAESDYSFHFRHITYYNVVDIFSRDGINFKTVVVTNLRESGTKKGINVLHYSKDTIDNDVSNKIGNIILKANLIRQNESKKDIKLINPRGQYSGLKMSFKYPDTIIYWPSTYVKQYHSELEINNVQEVVNKIDSILNLESRYSKLRSSLPYKTDNWGGTHFKVDKRELKKRYRDSVLTYNKKQNARTLWLVCDTIVDYLQKTVEINYDKYSEVDLYEEYYATYSKKGKLKKIASDLSNRNLKSATDSKQGKKILQEILKTTRLPVVKLRHDLTFSFSFYENDIEVYFDMNKNLN